tara:strand:- start:6655 stop:7521 length:867 start_codon:yes stop_codon:yes gene_type:complete
MRIALGTAQFGMKYGITNKSVPQSLGDIEKILNLSKASKINTIDTAIAYGKSESLLGKLNLDNFKIITKLPKIPSSINNIEKWVFENLEGSMERLNLKNIEGLLLHYPEDLNGENGSKLFESLTNLKKRKLVKKIGISIYSPSELENLLNNFSFDIIQSPFSIFDRRIKESGWLKKLKEQSIEVHTRSCFLQGLLLMNINDIDHKFFRWNDLFKKFHSWADSNNLNLLDICLSFPLSHNQIDRVVVGVDDINQLNQILQSNNVFDIHKYPDIFSKDEMLINPSNWEDL